MTKLEWCRANAPNAIKDLPDDEVLNLMGSSYDRFVLGDENDSLPETQLESVECDLNDVNNQLDYMVLELVREFGNSLAFKEGYILTKLLKTSARQTADVDFSVESAEIYKDIKLVLENIGKHFLSTGLIVNYIVKDRISPDSSGGASYYRENGSKLV